MTSASTILRKVAELPSEKSRARIWAPENQFLKRINQSAAGYYVSKGIRGSTDYTDQGAAKSLASLLHIVEAEEEALPKG